MIRPNVRRLVRLVRRSGDKLTRDVDEEVALHIELRTAQLINLGMAPTEAHAEATRRFGRESAAKYALHDIARKREGRLVMREWLNEVVDDFSHAARGLRREPMFAALVCTALALGVGANAAMFGIVDRLLIRGPDHVENANGLKRVYETTSNPAAKRPPRTTSTLGYVSYAILRDHAKAFSGVAAYATSVDGITMGRGESAELINLGQSTAGFFSLLGVQPVIGRFYGAAEDDVASPQNVVVIDYDLWQTKFQGRTNVLGTELRLADEPYSIIGVTPRGFTGPELTRTDVWIPISVRSRRITPNWTTAWDAQWLSVLARLKPGVSVIQADDDATAVNRSARTPSQSTVSLSLRPINFTDRGRESAEAVMSRLLLGVSVVVLLTAVFNVINLLLARAARRERELAVRTALGSGRWRLARMLLIEGIVLSALSGIAALLLAQWLGALIRGLLLPDVLWTSPTVDLRVFVATSLLVLIIALLMTVVTGIRAVRPNLVAALISHARGGGRRLNGLRRILTAAQASFSAILLIGAGLFVMSLHRVRSADLGMEANRVLVATLEYAPDPANASPTEYSASRSRSSTAYANALQSASALAGVGRASLAIGLPFSSSFGVDLRVPGWDSLPDRTFISAVGPSYFQTIGTRIVRGRTFTETDRAGSEPVAVVNETMAGTLWPGRNAEGQVLLIGDAPPTPTRVVGVVADVRQNSINEDPSMHYYVPIGQERGFGGTQLLIRPDGNDPAAIIASLRTALLRVDPTLLFVNIELLQHYIDPQFRPWRLGASLFAVMGVLAFAVAAVGLYSVMSYFVEQRKHEIGLRLALGSTGGQIVRHVMSDSLTMAAVGVAMGCGVGLASAKYLSALLFNTSPREPLIFVGTAVCLLSVGLLAGIIPGVRAKRINPIVALRGD